MGIVESGLSRLFDYQKYEKEPKLQSVIDEAENGYSGIRKLTDIELEYAAGGVEITGSDDPQANGRCKEAGCTAYLRKTASGYMCPDCGAVYDENKNLITVWKDQKKGVKSFF